MEMESVANCEVEILLILLPQEIMFSDSLLFQTPLLANLIVFVKVLPTTRMY